MAYETLIVEAHDAVTLIRLNRPEALNALNSRLLEELGQALDAAEAERAGLVSRIVPADRLVAEALEAAAKIAGQSPLAVMMNVELVDAAYETTLAAGVAMERRLFHSLFAFEDQKEGMAAFIEKRKPDFRGR